MPADPNTPQNELEQESKRRHWKRLAWTLGCGLAIGVLIFESGSARSLWDLGRGQPIVLKVEELLDEGDLGEAYVEVTNAELDSRFLVEKEGERIRSVIFAAKNYGRDTKRQLFIRVGRVGKAETLLDLAEERRFRGRLSRDFHMTPEQETEFEAHFGAMDATKMLMLEAR